MVQNPPAHWIVICPEPYVRGGVWERWHRENCVAVGWPPSGGWTLDGPTDDDGWKVARRRLKEIRIGDKVVPFLLKWRIGPVGTVTGLRIADSEWDGTVEKGNYRGSNADSDLGRRILVTWERDGMPPDGECSLIPPRPTSRPVDCKAHGRTRAAGGFREATIGSIRPFELD